MKCRIFHTFFRIGVTTCLSHWPIVWRNAIFVSMVTVVFTLSFVARIVLTKQKTTPSFAFSQYNEFSLMKKLPCVRTANDGSMTIETTSFEITFIWEHDHLRQHSFETYSFETTSFKTTFFETCSFETTFTWEFFIWDHIHLRPHLFKTTFIWDHIHLRPHWFETTFIWDDTHFAPC